MKKFIIGLLAVGLSFNTLAGGKGNGGDLCENKILNIRNNIRGWINSGASKMLVFPEGLNHSSYKESMVEALAQTKVSCTQNILKIDQAEKTCVNFVDQFDGSRRIVCNYTRFNAINETEQYTLIHHEYAGVAKIETNNGSEESNYFLSNQVTGKLVDKIVKRLPIIFNLIEKDLFQGKVVAKSHYLGHSKVEHVFNIESVLLDQVECVLYEIEYEDEIESCEYPFTLKMIKSSHREYVKIDNVIVKMKAGNIIKYSKDISSFFNFHSRYEQDQLAQIEVKLNFQTVEVLKIKMGTAWRKKKSLVYRYNLTIENSSNIECVLIWGTSAGLKVIKEEICNINKDNLLNKTNYFLVTPQYEIKSLNPLAKLSLDGGGLPYNSYNGLYEMTSPGGRKYLGTNITIIYKDGKWSKHNIMATSYNIDDLDLLK